MSQLPLRAHVVAGGFPRGSAAGHDHDFARMRILEMLYEMEVPASVGNDFLDIGYWLPVSRLMITYTAGPYLGEEQNEIARKWISEGGRWLALHGTSGGRAVRVPNGERPRRQMVKLSHHETLGGFFINHPPVRKFKVDVHDGSDPLTRDMPASFEVIDEPYMIEVADLPHTKVLLTAELGPDASPPGFGFVYDEDTALLPDGKTRVLGYSKDLGDGGVTYIALGHCHTPATNSQPFVDRNVDPEGKTPPLLRDTWENKAYQTLLRNAIRWGMG